MKKVLLSVAAMLMAGATFAQVKFGVVAGPQFSSQTYKMNGNKETSDLLTGLRGGVTVDLPLADEFVIQPSLLYSGKGGKEKNGNFEGKMRIHYLQLPVNFMFKPEVGSGNLYLGAGPYFAMGLGGKLEGQAFGLTGSRDIDWDNDIKRFDAGANLQFGYELPQGLNFGLYADLGLVNIQQNGNSDNSRRNTSFGVTVGYKFAGR
ncbi:porin family protein [Chitinophaga rhizosphaerae]|uniref:porin family protein n=1 Tax=Chitinophaga rhizosphaerae TaxID=1864947 RepID=UPI000F80C6BD|nr:porin family protein [Chitinophaga rhizosphaerae]